MPPDTAPARASGSVRSAILLLGAVNAIDMAFQLLLPMLIVRLLSGAEFGVYRLLWLIAGTALSVLPMALPASLFYFLPRTTGPARASYVAQATWFMAIVALLAGGGCWLWLRDEALDAGQQAAISGFVALWLFASLLDGLLNAQQANRQQAQVNGVFAFLRFALIASVALWTRSLSAVLGAHLVLAAIKAIVCLHFAARAARPDGLLATDARRWQEQWRYALPFGLSTGLYLLRGRIDQWLVAALFTAAQFGLYSVAAVFSPVQGLIRSALNNVVLPELNRLQAGADVPRMMALNQRGNLAVAFVMFPTLAFLSAVAGPLLALLFTADFAASASVVRLYCLTLLIESMEVTMLLTAFRQGPFLMRLDAWVLVVSVAVGAGGAILLGLPGAALGGVAGALLAQMASYRRCASLAGRVVRELQPWNVLVRILLVALLAGAVASTVLAAAPTLPVWQALPLATAAFIACYWIGLRLMRLGPVIGQVFGERLVGLLSF